MHPLHSIPFIHPLHLHLHPSFAPSAFSSSVLALSPTFFVHPFTHLLRPTPLPTLSTPRTPPLHAKLLLCLHYNPVVTLASGETVPGMYTHVSFSRWRQASLITCLEGCTREDIGMPSLKLCMSLVQVGAYNVPMGHIPNGNSTCHCCR